MKGKYGQRYFIIHLFIAKLKSQQTKSLAILTFDFYVSPRMLRYKCDSCVRRSVLLMFFLSFIFHISVYIQNILSLYTKNCIEIYRACF